MKLYSLGFMLLITSVAFSQKDETPDISSPVIEQVQQSIAIPAINVIIKISNEADDLQLLMPPPPKCDYGESASVTVYANGSATATCFYPWGDPYIVATLACNYCTWVSN